MTDYRTRGVLFVHSSPKALCPHIEWATGGALGRAVNFSWDEQPVLRGCLKTEYLWEGPVGSAAAIASALRGWEHLRFEITEDASPGVDGGRFMHTPDLGIFYAQMDAVGNTVVSEDRIIYALEVAEGDPREIAKEVRLALGRAWEDELEPFRRGSEQSSVVWFHRVG